MEAALGKVGGSLIKGAAGLEAGKYNRDVYNAQAAEEIAVAKAEALGVRDLARNQMGLQIADQAESGFAPGTGSSLRYLEESAISAELDILNLRRAAAGKAAALRAQAKMAKNEGRMAMSAGMTEAAGHIASAIAGGAGSYGG